MAWLCFNAAHAACLRALFAAFNIFSELATFRPVPQPQTQAQPLPLPQSLPHAT